MKIQLNNQTAELIEESEDICMKCPFNISKYHGCPYCSNTILDCNNKNWIIMKSADIFTL